MEPDMVNGTLGTEDVSANEANPPILQETSGKQNSNENHESTKPENNDQQVVNSKEECCESKKTLFCSFPLEKVQTVLAEYSPPANNTNVGKMRLSRKIFCLYCERTFVNINLREKHIERCHSTKQLRRASLRNNQNLFTSTPCMHCDKFTPIEHSLKDLFKHLIDHHSNKYYGCFECEIRFLNRSHLVDHNIITHNLTSPTITDFNEEAKETEIVSKIKENERRKTKRTQDDQAKPVNLRCLRGRKTPVVNSKLRLKRSRRLQEKTVDKKPETNDKKKFTKTDPTTEKSKNLVNPYPEFDNFFQVKKITDHSIDNLKISSLTFDDVFDKAFFNRIKCNIQENLLNHIDGKLFKNEESESRISNFEKGSNVRQETYTSVNTETFGCEVSLNAIAPTTLLLSSNQFGDDPECQIEYGSKPSKRKLTVKTDVVHYKYFTRRKYQTSIMEQKENRDLSKLDIWTQYIIKTRQQKIIDDKRSPKEILDYFAGEEYKNLMRKEELNKILDRRGPFEDLKEEATKKAALDKLNGDYDMSNDHLSEIEGLLNEMLDKVFDLSENPKGESSTETRTVSETISEIPSYLNLRPISSTSENEIDKSDKITLICSSQETENFELNTSKILGKDERVELTGEWARPRIYVCAACGLKLQNIKQFLEHKSASHQYIWVQHYEFVGNQSELYRHLSIPVLGKVSVLESESQGRLWKKSEARMCSKCNKQCNSLGELHRHILECGGDWTWMLVRKKYKYRPFGAKSRRKRRGLVKRLYTHKTQPTEKKIYKKPFDLPRQKPSDAETIKRMLANLPAKRITRKIIPLQSDTRPRQTKTQKQTKLKIDTTNEKKEKEFEKPPTKKQNSRRSLRSLNKMIGNVPDVSRIVKRQYNKKEQNSKEDRRIVTQKRNFSNNKRSSARIEKMLERKSNAEMVTLKHFFPVKKTLTNFENVKNTFRTLHKNQTVKKLNGFRKRQIENGKQPVALPIKKKKVRSTAKAEGNVEVEECKSAQGVDVAQVVSTDQNEEVCVVEKVACETQESTMCVDVAQPPPSKQIKRKPKRSTRGLNDCIAMLTNKLSQSMIAEEPKPSDYKKFSMNVLKIPFSDEQFELDLKPKDKVDISSSSQEQPPSNQEEIASAVAENEETAASTDLPEIVKQNHVSDSEDEIPLIEFLKEAPDNFLTPEDNLENCDDSAMLFENNSSTEETKLTTTLNSILELEKPDDDDDDDDNVEKEALTADSKLLFSDAPIDHKLDLFLEDESNSFVLPQDEQVKLKEVTNHFQELQDLGTEHEKLKNSSDQLFQHEPMLKSIPECLNEESKLNEESSDDSIRISALENVDLNTSDSSQLNKENKNYTDNIKKDSENSTELRRSLRNSRRITSYNECDIVDPLLDDIDSCKTISKIIKETTNDIFGFKKKERRKRRKNVLTEEKPVLDVIEISNKNDPSDSIFDNLNEISNDFNEDTTECLDKILKKSLAIIEENLLDQKLPNKEVENNQDNINCQVAKDNDIINQIPLEKNQPKVLKRNKKSRKVNKRGADTDPSEIDKKLTIIQQVDEMTDTISKSIERVVQKENIYCEICDKTFSRVESLTKHKRTLTHISKLSELEARQALEKSASESCDQNEIQLNDSNSEGKKEEEEECDKVDNSHLKLADIISDVLNKPILEKDEFQQSICDNEINTLERHRYKSLAERKSFDSDNLRLTPVDTSAGTILEKQITLLENIIENHSGIKYLDDMSLCSDTFTSKNDQQKEENHVTEEVLKQPLPNEEISNDSHFQCDDHRMRKKLNRDEELFLECCSLLKSASEISNYSKKINHFSLNDFTLKNDGWFENGMRDKEDFVEYPSDNSEMHTPLGDHFSEDDSENWELNNSSVSARSRQDKDDANILSFEELFNAKEDSQKTLFKTPLVENSMDSDENDNVNKSSDCEEIVMTESKNEEKRTLTKGARKVFEGLKVSIPTEELNIDTILTQNSPCKSYSMDDDEDKRSVKKEEPKRRRKSPNTLSLDMDSKGHDVYDFEETQDNSDMFTKPNFRSYRNDKNGKSLDKSTTSDEDSQERTNCSSSTSSISESPRKKTEQNITKKKCMIMGRIFKNAAKSKNAEEDIRNIPEMDNTKLVENFVVNCSTPEAPKTRMTQEELNLAFDRLLCDGGGVTSNSAKLKSPSPTPSKNCTKRRLKNKKRSHTNSESSDDEFKLQRYPKKRSRKRDEESKESCINLEQELKECIGVASRKSQRKCTSGKQNVLIEYWSSDESSFETITVAAKVETVVENTTNIIQEPCVVEKKKVKSTTNTKPEKPPSSYWNNRGKRVAVNPLYHWSSSSEDETENLIEIQPLRDEGEDDEDRPVQHGWIVGDSPKKLVTMLAQAKGKKCDVGSVKEHGKKRTSSFS